MAANSSFDSPIQEIPEGNTRLSLTELLTSLCEQVSGAMGVHFVKVLRVDADQNLLWFEAGVGWKGGHSGTLFGRLDTDSMAGYAAQHDQATMSRNLEKDDRFTVPKLLREHGIRSAANAIIKVDGKTFGVLEIDSDRAREFSREDLELLQHFANVASMMVGQSMLAARNQELVTESRLLLRELRHRVKNNNYVLRTMVQLQQHTAESEETKRALEAVVNRLTVTAVVNDVLTHSAEDALEGGPYLLKVARSILRERERLTDIEVTSKFDSFVVGRDTAEALAVILNEAITNSMMHGIPGGGTIYLSGFRENEYVVLSFSDDGPGFDPNATVEGFGMRLVRTMANQIDGKVEWTNERGARLSLHLPTSSSPQ
ncbi:MAG: GAF domain-containing protein [Spirochaetales bacterium]